jgi:malate dehydrogenase (oxaloacetate-decarboxylating)(NADP+)
MKIPVFHDDQHGTAIISGAALLNALEVVGKDISKVRVVFNGAGAAGIACAGHYVRLGVKRENIILCDTKGVVYKGRKDGMNKYKERFAQDTKLRTLAEAMVGADVFAGLSVKGAINGEMIRSMAPDPIVFAMANPDPEITYERPRQAGRTSSSPRGALTIPTRSTMFWDSPLSSAEHSTCAPSSSTKR